MRKQTKHQTVTENRRTGFYGKRRSMVPPQAREVITQFEVQQRDEVGPVRRMLFARERDALAFADMLAHWMARRGERGSVLILWPSARARALDA